MLLQLFQTWGVGASICFENVCIETIDISFESTQNKQQYGAKMICTEVRKKGIAIRNVIHLFSGYFLVLTASHPV